MTRHEQGELTILPMIARACVWKNIDWLQKMNVTPKDGQPVWSDGGSHIDEDLADIAEKIASLIELSPPTQNPSNIFISYKRKSDPDEPIALYLKEFLGQAGHTIFIDQNLPIGVDWAAEIKRLITHSHFMIVLLSEASVNSEMVAEEVEFAHKTGQTRLLPVRVAYPETLPYQLSPYLDHLQYAAWHNEAGTPHLAQQLFDAVENIEAWQPPTSEPGPTTTAEAGFPPPQPQADPRFIELLDTPGGAIRAQSTFYVERRADRDLEREILKPAGTTTTIRAPRQTGKTSLLIRGITKAKQANHKLVHLDFERVGNAVFQTPDTLLRYLAETMVRKLRLDLPEINKAWDDSLPPADKLNYLLEDYVLPAVESPILLALDEVERLLKTSYHDDIFSMIRFWHNSRASDELWEKLNIVMVISTEPHLLIQDTYRSPFNVGQRLELVDFDELHLRYLYEQYRTPVAGQNLAHLMTLFGGHPYLTQKALYTLVKDKLTWPKLVEISSTDTGPFGDHLRRYLWLLHDQPDLIRAMKEIINHSHCPDEELFYRLLRAGLVKGDSKHCACRCQLYHTYFGSRL